MKKSIVLLLTGGLLVGCGTAEEPIKKENTGQQLELKQEDAMELQVLEGYVTQVLEDGRYVIARNVVKDGHTEVLIVSTEEKLEVGDYVKASYDIVMLSFPGQTAAKKMEVIEQKIDSTLTTKEVVAAVADTLEGYPIIADVQFDAKQKQWTLQYATTNLGGEQLVGAIVKDEKPAEISEVVYEQPPTVQWRLNDTDTMDTMPFTLQSYHWTYKDLKTGKEQTVEKEVPDVTFVSESEATPLAKPTSFNFQAGQAKIVSTELVVLNGDKQEIARIVDGKGTLQPGFQHLQLTVHYEQGTAVYVQSVNVK